MYLQIFNMISQDLVSARQEDRKLQILQEPSRNNRRRNYCKRCYQINTQFATKHPIQLLAKQ